MLAKNAEFTLAGPGCRLIRQPRQPINSETEFAKASQGPADEFIVRAIVLLILTYSYLINNCVSDRSCKEVSNFKFILCMC